MNFTEIYQLYGFYQHELKENMLGFWLPRCEDTQYGGFVNCFDNRGEHLISHDKYAWSQGRFVWVFARLASTPAPIFTARQRQEFLRLAAQGTDFLMSHCLINPEDWRVVFLMNRDGSPKEVSPGAPLDMSIYADCFVIAGLAMYAWASGREEPYRFAKKLYESALARVESGKFHTLPYPLAPQYRAHGIPMIFSNVTRELYRAALKLDEAYCPCLIERLEGFASDILTHFVDANNVLHEVITCDNQFFPDILGQHINPGHTIEDTWFLLDAADLCQRPDWEEQIYDLTHNALTLGWDKEYGGLLHFAGMQGGQPLGDAGATADEPMNRQLSGWADKLWWLHSEGLYTTLLCHFRTGSEDFLHWHNRLFDYTYRTFPNPDPEIREWIQIRQQDGSPQEKVVALPVKDPYHIMRNLILICELLWQQLESAKD